MQQLGENILGALVVLLFGLLGLLIIGFFIGVLGHLTVWLLSHGV